MAFRICMSADPVPRAQTRTLRDRLQRQQSVREQLFRFRQLTRGRHYDVHIRILGSGGKHGARMIGN